MAEHNQQENLGVADELASVREQMRILRGREEELKVAILTDPSCRVGKAFVASVRQYNQHRVDTDRLRRNYPDVAEAVSVDVPVQQIVLSSLTADGEILPPRSSFFRRKPGRKAQPPVSAS